MSDTNNDEPTPDPEQPVEDVDGDHRVPPDLIDLAVALEAHEAGMI